MMTLALCLLPVAASAQATACSPTNPDFKNSTFSIADASCARTVATRSVNRAALKGMSGQTKFKPAPDDLVGSGFRVLYSFQGPPDGMYPSAPPVEDTSGNLYLTTPFGGANHDGSVIEFTSYGAEEVLYNFAGISAGDGYMPTGSLMVDSSGNLWGYSEGGGSGCTPFPVNGCGTVFELPSTGPGAYAATDTVVGSFTGGWTDGVNPFGTPVRDASGNFYGVTVQGGYLSPWTSQTQGIVFKMDPSGNVTSLHDFQGDGTGDGGMPNQTVAMDSSGNLYGTTFYGGDSSSCGVVFEVNPTTQTETILHTFSNGYSDGCYPTGSVTMDAAGNLYGVSGGGASGNGAVYKLSPSGSGTYTFTLLYSFSGNADGGGPTGPVALDSFGNVYGTTHVGGNTGTYYPAGVLFKVSPGGTETVLHIFDPNQIYPTTDGSEATGVTLAPDGNLYGTNARSGTYSFGTLWGYKLYNILNLTVAGTGNGAVTSTPAGLNCTAGTCPGQFAPKSVVTLTETPGTGSTFSSWGGACSGTSTTCTVTMSAAASVTATFNSTSTDTTATTLTSSLNPSAAGQAVTLTATVTAISGTPTGTVTFYDGTAVLGTGSLSSGKATYTTSSLPVGSNSITAVYSGTSSFVGSTSSPLIQIVNTTSTTTAVVSSLNPSIYGQSVTFTATVTPQYGICTGIVTFNDGPTSIGADQLNASNVAAITLSTLPVGNNSITVVYSGDSNCQGSTSSVLLQTVKAATTTTTVVSSLNPSNNGLSVTFTATITPQYVGGTLTGTVTFNDGTTPLVTEPVTGATVQYITAGLAIGTHSITAVYSGDSNNKGSTSPVLTETVNPAKLNTTTTLVVSPNPAVQGNPVSLTATVTSTGTPTGPVQFTSTDQNGVTSSLGQPTLKNGVATLTTSLLSAGTYSITALYLGDNLNNTSASSAVKLVVNPPGSPSFTLSASPNAVSVAQGASGTSTITITPQNGFTGSVTLAATGLPSGVTAGFSPNPATSTSTLTFTASAIAATGTATVTITGTSDSLNATTTIALTVTSGSNPITITWPTPAPITYGTKLSAIQLDAKATLTATGATVPGKFVYTPPATTILTAGSHTLSVTFTPTSKTYSPVTATNTLTVNPVTTTTTINTVTVSTTNPLEVTVAFTVTQKIANVTKATGNVTVAAGTGETCSATLAATGKGSCSLTFATAGAKTLTATYAGDSNNLTSTSAVKKVTVK